MKEWLFKQVGKGLLCVLSAEDQSDPNVRYTVSFLLLPRCHYISAHFLNSARLQRELLRLCPSRRHSKVRPFVFSSDFWRIVTRISKSLHMCSSHGWALVKLCILWCSPLAEGPTTSPRCDWPDSQQPVLWDDGPRGGEIWKGSSWEEAWAGGAEARDAAVRYGSGEIMVRYSLI